MKGYSCRIGHKFDDHEVKQYWNGLAMCPYCWPNGFMRARRTPAPLDADVKSSQKGSCMVYDDNKEVNR